MFPVLFATNGIDQEFESFETGILDSRLEESYASVRKADGEHFKKSALYNLWYNVVCQIYGLMLSTKFMV
jgi:hypothetical protein